jgi:hypothetical protein
MDGFTAERFKRDAERRLGGLAKFLKPCPKCGATADLAVDWCEHDSIGNEIYSASCACGFFGEGASASEYCYPETEAVLFWNAMYRGEEK